LGIKLEINQGYTTMHGQPVIKISVLVLVPRGMTCHAIRYVCALPQYVGDKALDSFNGIHHVLL